MFGVSLRLVNRVSTQNLCRFLQPNAVSNSVQTRLDMSSQKQYPPIEQTIRTALTNELNPVFMEVINESPMHNTPKRAESHFRVFVVSDKFNDLTLIKRHRLVNDAVKASLDAAGFDFIHALSIEAKTPKQWVPEHEMAKSPPCLGGHGK